MLETDIAWLAGLLEGEGSFGLDKRSATRYAVSTAPPSPFFKISMSDRDVIMRVAALVGRKIHSPNKKTKGGKTMYIVHVGDRPTLTVLLPKLFPYLGARRQAKVQELLDAIEAHKVWEAEGGKSKMAQEGPKAKANRNLAD